MGRVYTAEDTAAALTTVVALIEVSTPATSMVKYLSAFAGQESLAGDSNAAMLEVGISRHTASGAGGNTAITPIAHEPGEAAHGLTVDSFHPTVGAGESNIIREAMNIQAGWYYAPIPEEMIWQAPSLFTATHLFDAPASSTWHTRLTFEIFGV